jgi:chromate transporter
MDGAQVPSSSLLALFVRFLRFGMLAWGGPVAQIAMLRRELVEEERWISSERFNRTLAVYQVLPGPEAHELTVFFGYLARGRLGGLVAGLGFMLPGFVLMLGLSWAYLSVGLGSPSVSAFFAGAQVAVLALIVRAVHRIGAHAISERWLAALAVASFAASLAGVVFAVTLVSAGASHALVRRGWRAAGVLVLLLLLSGTVIAGTMNAQVEAGGAQPTLLEPEGRASPLEMLGAGLRAGLLSFGGAYSALPVIEADAVNGGWLNRPAILDGMALAGVLPAPLIIFATFVGYAAGGIGGALAITLGVFLPAFAFTLVGHRWLERLVAHRGAHAFLDGVTAGVVGLIAATAVRFVPTVLTGGFSLLLWLTALVVLYRWRAGWVVAAVVLAAGAASVGWHAAALPAL